MIKHPTEERVYRMLGGIAALFNRRPGGWGARDTIGVMEPLVRPFMDGRVRVRCVHLPLAACVAGMRETRASNSETLEHYQIKASAIAWMRASGARDASAEQECGFGRADVYSEKHGWVVECGHTAMRKLTSATAYPEPTRFTLIPFQEQTRRDGSARRLVAADFEWDADLREEVQAFARAKTAALFASMPRWGLPGMVKASPLAPRMAGGV